MSDIDLHTQEKDMKYLHAQLDLSLIDAFAAKIAELHRYSAILYHLPKWDISAYRSQSAIGTVDPTRMVCKFCGVIDDARIDWGVRRVGQKFCSNWCAAKYYRAVQLAVYTHRALEREANAYAAARDVTPFGMQATMHTFGRHIKALRRSIEAYAEVMITHGVALHGIRQKPQRWQSVSADGYFLR